MDGSTVLFIFGFIYVAIALALFFVGRALHRYSLQEYGYTPYNKSDIAIAALMVLPMFIGLYLLLISASWIGYIFLGVSGISGVISFMHIKDNSSAGIAIGAISTYLIAAILVVVGYLIYKFLTAKSDKK